MPKPPDWNGGPKGPDSPPESTPGAPKDLVNRLHGLPPGHPSSPVHADGKRKPPVPDTAENEFDLDQASALSPGKPELGEVRIKPFTDAEYIEHAKEVRARLIQARKDGLATDNQYTIDPDHEVWAAEREAQHDALIEDLYKDAIGVPCEGRAIVAGGLPGAGKTSVLDNHAQIDRTRYITINPDNIKEEMARRGLIPIVAGLSPMEASDLVHEESSHLAKRLAFRAQAERKNLIWDITMSSFETTTARIADLRESGYNHIEGLFVHLPPETSAKRAAVRHRDGEERYRSGQGQGGRFIPEGAPLSRADPEWGSLNRRVFERVKKQFDAWSIYDNSVDGRRPILLERGF